LVFSLSDATDFKSLAVLLPECRFSLIEHLPSSSPRPSLSSFFSVLNAWFEVPRNGALDTRPLFPCFWPPWGSIAEIIFAVGPRLFPRIILPIFRFPNPQTPPLFQGTTFRATSNLYGDTSSRNLLFSTPSRKTTFKFFLSGALEGFRCGVFFDWPICPLN